MYELTEWGRELEPVVTKLGAWGARSSIEGTGKEARRFLALFPMPEPQLI